MPSASRPPIFAIASWIAPTVLALLTLGIAHMAKVAGQARGQWLPGLGVLLIGIIVVAFSAFACGLAALLRGERHRWVAILPFLVGLGFFLYLGWQRLS